MKEKTDSEVRDAAILAALEGHPRTTLEIRDELDDPVMHVLASLRRLRDTGVIEIGYDGVWTLRSEG